MIYWHITIFIAFYVQYARDNPYNKENVYGNVYMK